MNSIGKVSVLFFVIEAIATREKSLPLCRETKLEDTLCTLVENYDHLSPPKYPTEISTEITFRAIQDIDESKHSVTSW